MASWQKEYLQALDDRDKKEKANYEFYSSCLHFLPKRTKSELTISEDSKLADRMATVDQRASGDKDSSQALLSPSNVVNPAAAALSAPLSTENIAKIREDLGEAQRSKGIMQSRLQKVSDELQKLKMHSALDKNRIVELSSERTILLTKIKDRDEELKGKAKLLEVSQFP